MEIYYLSPYGIAFSAEAGVLINREETKDYIQQALISAGFAAWSNMCIDFYGIKDENICFAYPCEYSKISIAPYALPFIEEYFTE